MSETPPILVRFTGVAFAPANAPMLQRARENFDAEGIYRIEFKEERSETAHQAYFASVVTAWKNLPENLSAKYPTPDAMRYQALVINGYIESETDIPAPNKEQARIIGEMIRKLNSYAIIVPQDNVVKVYIAQSQKMLRSGRGMDKKTFHQSADAVLATVAEWANTTPAELRRNVQDDGTERIRNQINTEPSHRTGHSATARPAGEISGRVATRQPSTPDLPSQSQTGGPAKAPPPVRSGASPARAITPELPVPGGASPEEKNGPGGGQLQPKCYDEYKTWLPAWLGFTTSATRITARYSREQSELWPTFKPRLTEGQERYFDKMVSDAIKQNA